MTLSFNIFGSEAAQILSAMQAASFDRDSGQAWSEPEIATLLHSPGVEALVGSEGHDPAGFLLSRRVGEEAEILSICVVPPHRRKTVGHQLIEQFCHRADSVGVREIWLEVNEIGRAHV